jgi:hypothetical protein
MKHRHVLTSNQAAVTKPHPAALVAVADLEEAAAVAVVVLVVAAVVAAVAVVAAGSSGYSNRQNILIPFDGTSIRGIFFNKKDFNRGIIFDC